MYQIMSMQQFSIFIFFVLQCSKYQLEEDCLKYQLEEIAERLRRTTAYHIT